MLQDDPSCSASAGGLELEAYDSPAEAERLGARYGIPVIATSSATNMSCCDNDYCTEIEVLGGYISYYSKKKALVMIVIVAA